MCPFLKQHATFDVLRSDAGFYYHFPELKLITVKRWIIGEDLFGEIGEFNFFGKISRHQMKKYWDDPLSSNNIAKLNLRQIVIFSKAPNIIVTNIYRFTVTGFRGSLSSGCLFYPDSLPRQPRTLRWPTCVHFTIKDHVRLLYLQTPSSSFGFLVLGRLLQEDALLHSPSSANSAWKNIYKMQINNGNWGNHSLLFNTHVLLLILVTELINQINDNVQVHEF